jgi:ribosomal protein L11 methyltransferase
LPEFIELDIELAGLQEFERDLAIALLADFGFEGFREEEGSILAYIRSDAYDPDSFESFLDRQELRELIRSVRSTAIPETNWNALWEKDYSPVEISGKCLVRAPFHTPRRGMAYDLVISPKMSFGTAHHETTRLMIEAMLEQEWIGRKVLDFGSGTAVLAILAEKMGAAAVVALDNDPRAFRNSFENLELNGCRHIRTHQGELVSLDEYSFHVILGNINLNVLIAEMENLSARLETGGIAILSGFFRDDLETLNRNAAEHGLTLTGEKCMNRWTVAVYIKGE